MCVYVYNFHTYPLLFLLHLGLSMEWFIMDSL